MGACSGTLRQVKIPSTSPIAALSERQLEEFREAFNTFDKDGGGSIDSAELKDLMQSVGTNPTDEEIAEMIAMADADGSGSVDFCEFVTLMAHNMAAASKSPESIAAAFRVFDVDGGGSISAVEMQRILMNVGEPMTKEDVARVIEKIDQDGSGEIEIQEFADFILGVSERDGAGQQQQQQQQTAASPGRGAVVATGHTGRANDERYSLSDPPQPGVTVSKV